MVPISTIREIMARLHAVITLAVPREELNELRIGGCESESVEECDVLDTIPGFTRLGAGHFSVVYACDDAPGVAFKVGIKAEDSGALYAAWVRDQPPNPHLPTILHLERFSDMWMAAMPTYIGSDAIWVNFEQSSMSWCLTTGREGDAKCTEYPALVETLYSIHDFFKGVAEFDLHEDNWMVDPNTMMPVITDPVSFNRKGEQDEL